MAETDRTSKQQRLTPTQARAARRSRRKTRKGFMRYAAFGGVGLIAIAFIVALFLPSIPMGNRSGSNIEDAPGERFPDQGNAHIVPTDEHSPYNSVPATSGWHFSTGMGESYGSSYAGPAPARWGVYNEFIPDEVLVHNLEHGGIRIHYNCAEACPDLAAKLARYAQKYREVLISPDPRLETTIVLVAWNFMLKLDEYNEASITGFIEAHENSANAPEWQTP